MKSKIKTEIPFAIKRRSFMKMASGFTLALAGGIAKPVKLLATEAGNLIKNGVVYTAAHWGPLKLTIRDGKIVKSGSSLRGIFKNDLQTVTHDLVYAKSRIKYPMVRESFLKNPDDNKPERRGSDKWVRVSYEEAIELTAGRLKKVRKEKGPGGVFAGSYGWYSNGALHNARVLLHRFMNMTGGFVSTSGDYSTGASQIIMPHVVGTLEVYEQQTTWPVVLKNSNVVVFWGANPFNTLKVSWTSNDGMGLTYLNKLKKSGKTVICIDPVRSETCQFLGARWIAPRPNTDVALMMGVAHTMLQNEKYDKDFISEYTEGFDAFKGYLLGEKDGTVKDSAWASGITGLSKDVIEELASLFFENRTMLMSGWSLQRQHHGEQAHWMLVTLASMIGQIGLPGGGFGLSYHYANGGVPTAQGGVISGIGIGKVTEGGSSTGWLDSGADTSFPVARITEALLNPGKEIDFNGNKITYTDIDFIYWVGGNPFCHQQDTNLLMKAWRKPSTVVVQDPFWTPTARHADIVFPATTSYERNDISMTGDYSSAHIVPMVQAVEKQNEAVDDYKVFVDLSKQFGVADQFTENKTEMEWIEQFYNSAVQSAKGRGVTLPSFKDFWNHGAPIQFKPTDESINWVRYGDFREDPLINPLGTPSGKIEIYSKVIEEMGYDDCPPHPTWMEPVEWLGMEDKKAEFAVVTTHPPYRLHSQLANTSLRSKYAVNDREPVWINDQDAKAKQIKSGDVVRIFNERGHLLAGAVVTKDVLAGSIRLCEGAWYDPVEKGKEKSLCKNGSVNVLSIDLPTSKLSGGNIGHTILANIEKYDKEAPSISVFDQPEMA